MKRSAALLIALVLAPVPAAHADGLSYCAEDSAALHREAQATVDGIGRRVPLGPYENADTVLQYVVKVVNVLKRSGVNCQGVMEVYAQRRIDGTYTAPTGTAPFSAPTGPGS